MKKNFHRLIGLALALAVFVPAATTHAVKVKKIILKGHTSFIRAKGTRPVVIKDDAQVKGDLTVDGTINGVDIVDMWGDVSVLQSLVAELQDNALPAGCSSDQIAKYDGVDWQCADSQYSNVLVVAQSGSKYTTITDAIAAINEAGDAGFANRYVISVAPGVYHEKITLPDYTDLVGASRDGVWLVGDSVSDSEGAINAGVSTTVTNITVTATGSGDVNGIYIASGDSLELKNAIVYISEITGNNARAVYNNGGTLTVLDSDLSAGQSADSAYGVLSDGSLTIERSKLHLGNSGTHNTLMALSATSTGYPVVIKDSEFEAVGSGTSSGADVCYAFSFLGNGATLTVQSSSFTASSCDTTERAADLDGSGSSSARIYNSQFFGGDTHAFTTTALTARIAGSLLEGGSVDNTCAYSYDENYAQLDSTCVVAP